MEYKDWFGKKHTLPKGKSVVWRPSVYALIIENKKILLTKGRHHGIWELPGGGIEMDETIIDALKREVREETGYNISVTDQRPVYGDDKFFYILDLDKYCHTIIMVFRAQHYEENYNPSVIHKGEIEEVGWFDLDELPQPLLPMAQEVINSLK